MMIPFIAYTFLAISFGSLALVWLIYPGCMWVWTLTQKPRLGMLVRADSESLPTISVVLPVRNAEASITKKVADLLNFDYPSDRLEIIIISDGSTDSTNSILGEISNDRVRTLTLPENVGKSGAQNAAFKVANGDLLLLTDVEAYLPPTTLRTMVGHFTDQTIGCVGARVEFAKNGWEVSDSHSAYWGFEVRLRAAESALGILTSVSGAAMLVRNRIISSLDEDTGDDFIIPLDLALAGFRTVYASEALVFDQWSSSGLRNELKTRRRMTLRNALGLFRRRSLLNPRKYGMLAISLLCHKLLRWFTPILALISLIALAVLASFSRTAKAGLLIEVLGLGTAAFGMACIWLGIHVPIVSRLGSFAWSSVGMAWGISDLLVGRRIHAYKPSSRAYTQTTKNSEQDTKGASHNLPKSY